MQIQKMLNTFIIIFLIINLSIFAYLKYADVAHYTVPSERMEQAKQVLEANGVTIATSLLTDYHPRTKLEIREPSNKLMEIKDLFFDQNQPMIPSEEAYIYETGSTNSGDSRVLKYKLLEEKGRMTYIDMAPIYRSKDFKSAIDNRKVVEGFVDDFTLTKDVYTLVDERQNNERDFYFYYFDEVYNGELVFCNEVRVKLEEQGLTEATGIRYDIVGFTEMPYEIYPPDDVLYKFMSYIKETGIGDVTLTDMDIGYYLGPDGLHDLGLTEIEPFYRLKIASGQTYYINGYTNQISIY